MEYLSPLVWDDTTNLSTLQELHKQWKDHLVALDKALGDEATVAEGGATVPMPLRRSIARQLLAHEREMGKEETCRIGRRERELQSRRSSR